MTTLADSVRETLISVLIFIGLIWAVFLLSWLFTPITEYGLQPRSPKGLIGIATMPFLHANLGHIIANTIPLLVLLFLLAGSRCAIVGHRSRDYCLGRRASVDLWPKSKSHRREWPRFRFDQFPDLCRRIRTSFHLDCCGVGNAGALRRFTSVGNVARTARRLLGRTSLWSNRRRVACLSSRPRQLQVKSTQTFLGAKSRKTSQFTIVFSRDARSNR